MKLITCSIKIKTSSTIFLTGLTWRKAILESLALQIPLIFQKGWFKGYNQEWDLRELIFVLIPFT